MQLTMVRLAADNLCYHFGLPERIRARVEDAGRVELADNEAVAIARSKEVHIMVIVASVLMAVASAGDAWSASETGDGYLRDPKIQPRFGLPAIGLWVVAAFEASENGMDHRNTIFGLRARVISHANRIAEIAMRICWTVFIRILTIPIVVMFFGAATWGFGSNKDGAWKADEEVTRAYWEAKGANWTNMVTAVVEAGRGPVWDDPFLFLTSDSVGEEG